MIKSTVKLEQLEKVSKGQIKKEIQKSTFVSVQTADDMHEKKLNFKQEIDVRGMRGDEALQAVTYFVDDAIQVGAARIRILHGTGTGILRQLIRDYLHTVPGNGIMLAGIEISVGKMPVGNMLTLCGCTYSLRLISVCSYSSSTTVIPAPPNWTCSS